MYDTCSKCGTEGKIEAVQGMKPDYPLGWTVLAVSRPQKHACLLCPDCFRPVLALLPF